MIRIKRSVDLEQFYTQRKLAKRCIDAVDKLFKLDSFSLILEPSAGDGAFFDQLPITKRVGIDLDPKNKSIAKQDFFDWEPPLFETNILTIGNPPFGQRACLAIDFIDRASTFSRVIGFILPRSFKKDTFLNRINENFHLVEQFDCDEFMLPNGLPTSVKSVFQIWELRSTKRKKLDRLTSHDDFDLKHAHISRTSPTELQILRDNFDFAIAQVGANFNPKNVDEITAGSYWFVKSKNPSVREIFCTHDYSFLDGMNLSFKSLSKKDIIEAYITAKKRFFETLQLDLTP
jgi:hypothetical protein